MVLTREIISDGVTYPPGTPVSSLPDRIRASVAESNWVAESAPAPASADEPANEPNEPNEPADDKPKRRR
jgi:hypothetical protein